MLASYDSQLRDAFAKNKKAADSFREATLNYLRSPRPYAPPAVMIVEDDISTGRMLQAFFKSRLGVEALLVGSAADAYDLLERREFKLVLVDLKLPDRPGWYLVEDLRRSRLNSSVPVIVVSGFLSDLEDVARKCGASDWISKPLDADLLQQKVKNLFNVEHTAEFPEVLGLS